MSSRLNRVWLLVPFVLLVGQAWALGLGDIRLSSALNQPLSAEIELLAATPEELNNLTVQLASQDTFGRYDLDRPVFLNGLRFEIVKSGRADGNIIRITSADPVTEPFITFLVEASWSRGRLLREYTLLLDPPTFAPPPTTQSTEAVTAPTRAAPADSGQIQRPAPQPRQQPAPPPASPPVRPPVQAQAPAQQQPPAAAPAPAQPAETPDTLGQPEFGTAPGGDIQVQRGDTLWGITQRVLPDSRLTINQTMLAIYEANPGAFDGNINRLRAGATLRIPSADDVFRISRGDAFSEVSRQHAEWRGEPAPAPGPVAAPVEAQPSLTLVPPDEEDDVSLSDTSIDTGVADTGDDAVVDPVGERIGEIEAILEDRDALIEISDNELAALRQELADLRGEELPVDETVADTVDETAVDEILGEDEDIVAGDEGLAADETAAAADADTPAVDTAPRVVSRPAQDDGIVDTVLGYLGNFWVWIGGALLAAVGILVWFMRRAARRDDEDMTGVWDTLDSDETDAEAATTTERLTALARDDDESIVVVETKSTDVPEPGAPAAEETAAADFTATTDLSATTEFQAPAVAEEPEADPLAASGMSPAPDDTFSSETAINLDQSDPVAEADFHMAYGLYDQAADLINGALTGEPDRQDLLAKLCEIYFVWGNRDAFVDAALRLKGQVGSDPDTEWDKIVIMGQQIAGDHEMFSGVSAEGVTKVVDLSLDGDGDAGSLDIDFASEAEDGANDIIDLGAEDEGEAIDLGMPTGDEIVADETGQVPIPPDSGSGIDFSLDDESDLDLSSTREMPPGDESPAFESMADDDTAEMPETDETIESPHDESTRVMSEDPAGEPAIEQQFETEATGEMPALSESESPQSPPPDATAEIDLAELGLDLDALGDSVLDADIEEERLSDLEDTSTSEQLVIDEDDLDVTGTREVVTIEAEPDSTGAQEVLDVETALAASGEEFPEPDDDVGEETDIGIGIDASLLDATGHTQVLTDDMAVETAADIASDIDDTAATMLAPGYGEDEPAEPLSDDAADTLASMDEGDDEGDLDYAKTEALPKDVFSPDMSTDDTGRMPSLAGSTDMDLDLDDLTAALNLSEAGDTINEVRDGATVEQPRIEPGEESDDTSTTGVTRALSPDDMSGDLSEARTMTEVGTKLDLARAYVDMGDPGGARNILEEVLDEGDEGQKQQAQQLIDSLPT